MELSIFHRTFLLGLLIASFPLAQFFGAPLIGELSDRFGRKKIFILTISGGILGYLMTGIAIHLKFLPLLWISRLWTGFFAGNLSLCLATVADISQTHQERVKNFGWIGTVGGIGFILAILLGGSFSIPEINMHPGTAFFVVSFLSLVNLGLMLWLFQESHAVRPLRQISFLKGIQNVCSIFSHSKLRIIYFAYFLFMLSWVSAMQFLSDYLFVHYETSVQSITLIFVGIGLIWSFSNFVLNRFICRIFDARKTFTFALFGITFFLFLTLFPQTILLFLIFFLSAVACGALSWTNGLATVSVQAPAEVQGGTLGLNQSVGAIASIIGPLLGGVIAGLNTDYIFMFSGLCSLAAALTLSLKKGK